MTNREKYNEAFVKVMDVKKEEVEKLVYQEIDAWDSVGHMELVSEIEDTFDIMMDTEDIIDFNSYEKGIEILKKYGIEI